MECRVREQSLGHLGGALAGPLGAVGLKLYLERVGRAQVGQFEPQTLQGTLCGLGLRVEHALFEPNCDGCRVTGHHLCGRRQRRKQL